MWSIYAERMTPQPANAQGVNEVYEVLLLAAVRRHPLAAIYDGLPRLFCPHVLGRREGRLRALCYQFGGVSKHGLETGGWRCLAVEKLSQVERCADEWHTEPRSGQQTCIEEIDYAVGAQPEPKPQNGQ